MKEKKSKYRQIKINILIEDHVEIKKIADETGISIATLFRLSLGVDMELNSRVPKNIEARKIDIPCHLSLLYHFSKIGTNLNQIAKRCNINKSVDRHTLFTLDKLYKEIWRVQDDS